MSRDRITISSTLAVKPPDRGRRPTGVVVYPRYDRAVYGSSWDWRGGATTTPRSCSTRRAALGRVGAPSDEVHRRRPTDRRRRRTGPRAVDAVEGLSSVPEDSGKGTSCLSARGPVGRTPLLETGGYQSVRTAPLFRRARSEVTSVRSCTRAVAAISRSAGSEGKVSGRFSDSMATSTVRGRTSR